MIRKKKEKVNKKESLIKSGKKGEKQKALKKHFRKCIGLK